MTSHEATTTKGTTVDLSQPYVNWASGTALCLPGHLHSVAVAGNFVDLCLGNPADDYLQGGFGTDGSVFLDVVGGTWAGTPGTPIELEVPLIDGKKAWAPASVTAKIPASIPGYTPQGDTRYHIRVVPASPAPDAPAEYLAEDVKIKAETGGQGYPPLRP